MGLIILFVVNCIVFTLLKITCFYAIKNKTLLFE
jgi:hypothetical protein